MRSCLLLLSLFALFGITISIFAPGLSGGFGGTSSSSSSEEHQKKHKHRPHSHRPRPHRPHPHRPRPPPQSDEEETRCPSDWMTFDRSQGTWCVKVFWAGAADQYTAQSLCQGQDATLSGVQDANENAQIAAAGRTVINQNGGGLGDMWLGASRKANCPTQPSCAPLDTFQWTDGFTTGVAGFIWGGAEPNGVIFPNSYSNEPWGQQNCLVQLISGSSNIAEYGYPHGSMDDQHCQKPFQMYACGKKPS